ncbi:unnamed protein product [Porites lobata]|uniref:THAP-type domain-containing protein n=1 Tax=Porites lobata TaxID=104759 RepID=A0ABN8QII7_9CNID|nr:unnamed protein product [Porites lobata]
MVCCMLKSASITIGTRVCSVHFKEADFKRTLTGKLVLKKHAVPSMLGLSRSPRKRKSLKTREPPHARLRLFDVNMASPPTVPITSKYCQCIVVSIVLNFSWLKSYLGFSFNP